MHEASKEKGKMELNGVSLLSVSYIRNALLNMVDQNSSCFW